MSMTVGKNEALRGEIMEMPRYDPAKTSPVDILWSSMLACFARRFRVQHHLSTLSGPSFLGLTPVYLPFRSSPLPSSPTFATCRKMATQLQVSEGQDYAAIEHEMKRLCTKDWRLTDGVQLEKTYHFKLHTKSLVRQQAIHTWPGC